MLEERAVKVLRHLAIGLTGATLLTGVAALAGPAMANAAVQTGLGYNVTPAQPYLNNPDASDWMGSFVVGGKQVWCVDFEFQAPDSNEQYQQGEPLKTKWGTALDPTVASEISYLLLRYGTTTSADDAAAPAHLLHSWTAAPQNPAQLDPSNDFRHVAYDVNYHYDKLPAGAQQAVQALQADASANHGPWTAALAKPSAAQTIGTAGNWTFDVLNAAGKEVPSVAVTLTATDATFADGRTTAELTTPGDASALTVPVTPTGPNPSVVATLLSPNAVPVADPAVNPIVQTIVTTGGEQQLTTTTTTTAANAPGAVHIAKLDANTKAPIVGASLELTGSSKTGPAVKQDGTPLVGSDGKPIVVTTGIDGTATISGLRTPQDVCVIETVAPPGYDQAFDASNPPTVCGTLTPGATLALTLLNTPNKVPVAIPAGGPPPTLTAMATVLKRPSPAALVGFGGLLLIAALVIGTVAGRRSVRRAIRRR
jgi:hypothetical protein